MVRSTAEHCQDRRGIRAFDLYHLVAAGLARNNGDSRRGNADGFGEKPDEFTIRAAIHRRRRESDFQCPTVLARNLRPRCARLRTNAQPNPIGRRRQPVRQNRRASSVHARPELPLQRLDRLVSRLLIR